MNMTDIDKIALLGRNITGESSYKDDSKSVILTSQCPVSEDLETRFDSDLIDAYRSVSSETYRLTTFNSLITRFEAGDKTRNTHDWSIDKPWKVDFEEDLNCIIDCVKARKFLKLEIEIEN